jgi:hypothetical protein
MVLAVSGSRGVQLILCKVSCMVTQLSQPMLLRRTRRRALHSIRKPYMQGQGCPSTSHRHLHQNAAKVHGIESQVGVGG